MPPRPSRALIPSAAPSGPGQTQTSFTIIKKQASPPFSVTSVTSGQAADVAPPPGRERSRTAWLVASITPAKGREASPLASKGTEIVFIRDQRRSTKSRETDRKGCSLKRLNPPPSPPHTHITHSTHLLCQLRWKLLRVLLSSLLPTVVSFLSPAPSCPPVVLLPTPPTPVSFLSPAPCPSVVLLPTPQTPVSFLSPIPSCPPVVLLATPLAPPVVSCSGSLP